MLPMRRAQVQSMVRELRSHMPQLKSSHDTTKRRRDVSEFWEKFWACLPLHWFNFLQSVYAQSCSTLWEPLDCSPLGSSVHGIFQARILEQVIISYPRGSSQPRDQTHVSGIAGRFFTPEPPGKIFLQQTTYKYMIVSSQILIYPLCIFPI